MILNIWTLITLPFTFALLATLYSAFILDTAHQIRKKFNYGRKIVKLKKLLKLQTRKKNLLEQKHYRRIINVWLCVLISFIFMMAMVVFESKGKNAANEVISNIKFDSFNIIKIKGSNVKLAALYCGSRNCAGLNLKTQGIIYFPQNGHSYFSLKKI